MPRQLYSSSNSDAGLPSAPPAPSSSEDADYDDREYTTPQWVQRMYGPPPTAAPFPLPEPAAVWIPDHPRTAPYVVHPGIVPVYTSPPVYNLNAYTPGAAPLPPGVAVMRARSPSLSSGMHPGAAGDPGAEDYVVPPRPQPFEAKPTKSPLYANAEADIEAAKCEEMNRNNNNNQTNKEPFGNPNMPSRNEALRERRKKQLRTCDKDSFGVPLPNTRRPFSLFASPFSVAEVCTGLGVYLASVQATIFLALILSLVGIYPLVDNIKNQHWAREYSLVKNSGPPVASCPKGWDLTSWLTATTIGGHCYGLVYTNKYDCAAQCVWTEDRLNQPQCRGVKPPSLEMVGNTTTTAPNSTYHTRLSGQCAQHLPCTKGRLDPNAPDGPCLCCQMRQDVQLLAKNPRVSAGQLWTFFLSQIVFMAWMLYLVHTQLKAVHIQGTRVLGASDYSAWIYDIPKSRAEDGPLAHWCGQFGPVVAAFNIPSVGDALRVGRRVQQLQIRKAESDAMRGSTSCCNPLQWFFRVIMVGNAQAVEETLEKQQRKLAIYERQESEATGQGLVTFEYTDSAQAAVSAFDTSPLRSLIDWVTLGLTNSTPRLHGATVKVIRAPEPSDILWEHTNCTGTPALLRRLSSWTFTALIILAGAGIQYGLAVAAEGLREDRMMSQYAAGTGAAWAVEEATHKTWKLRSIVMISAVVVVLINFCIMLTVRALSWYERWTTRTSMERWVMLKLSISQLCNAFGAPLLAAYISGNRSEWFSRGGLMEAAFYVQCANAVIPSLFHLLGLGDKIKYYVLSPYARTQPMLNQLVAPPLFPMAEQYAASVTTLGLAMWYMPVLPQSPMIAAVGLTVSYCANKWIALRRAAAPPNFSGMVTAPLNWLLRLLPLIQLILMKQIYFKDYPTIDPVFYTGLTFWTLFCLAPIRALLGAVRRRRRTNSKSSGLSYRRLLGGKRLGVGDVYAPIVPKTCSRKFKERVAATFAQLAPAAFETILNGEDVAKFLFGGEDIENMDANRLAAMGLTPQDIQEMMNAKYHDNNNNKDGIRAPPEYNIDGNDDDDDDVAPSAPPPPRPHRNSLRASLAAGLNGTLALLWQPQDADHPEDEFLPVARASASQASGTNHGHNHATRAHQQQRHHARTINQTNHTGLQGSTSDSCDSSDGGGSGGGMAATAVTPIQRGPAPFTSTPGSSAFQIPAVRHRTTSNLTPNPNVNVSSAPRVHSGARTGGGGGGGAFARETIDPRVNTFRPLGSGLPGSNV